MEVIHIHSIYILSISPFLPSFLLSTQLFSSAHVCFSIDATRRLFASHTQIKLLPMTISFHFIEEEPSPSLLSYNPSMARSIYHTDSFSSSSSSLKSSSLSSSSSSSLLPSVHPEIEETLLGSNGLIRKTEFVRVITQSLYSLGYCKSASLLEQESGIPLQSQAIATFQNLILEGKWDESIVSLKNLEIEDSNNLNSAALLILEQKYIHHLKKGNISEALKTLRYEISPLQTDKGKLHSMASCLICPDKIETLHSVVRKNSNSCVDFRHKILENLQGILSPSVMIPERRLEHLLEQCLKDQMNACTYHNSLDQTISLLNDHQCHRDQLPTQTVQILDDHENEVWFLQFSHNGKLLASASKDHTAKIWEVVSEDIVKLKCTLVGHEEAISLVSWSPNDQMILTCGHEEVVKLWDVESGTCKLTFDKPTKNFTACAWFPDGKRFISGGGDKYIYIWDVTGRQLDSWKGHSEHHIHDMSVTPDGSRIITISDKHIRIYNLETKLEQIISEEKSVTSLSVSGDGKLALVNLLNQEIHLWDIEDNRLLLKYVGHRQTRYVIRSCFGGANQAFIVSGSEDSQVYLWHRRKGELLEVLPGHAGTVNCVSWNPTKPSMFASASDDYTIRIWGSKKLKFIAKESSASNGDVHVGNGFSTPSL